MEAAVLVNMVWIFPVTGQGLDSDMVSGEDFRGESLVFTEAADYPRAVRATCASAEKPRTRITSSSLTFQESVECWFPLNSWELEKGLPAL